MMGLIGLIIASSKYFLGSSALQFAMSIIGVIIFAGLTNTILVIKEIYVENENLKTHQKQ